MPQRKDPATPSPSIRQPDNAKNVQHAPPIYGQSETRYRELFAGVEDAILVADAEARYLDANPAATALLGYTLEELLQLRVGDIVAAGPQWAETEYARFLRERHWHGELEVRRKDGSLVTVEAQATAITLPGGTIYVSVLRDISARRRSELAHAQLAAIVESSSDAIIGKSLDGTILSWNTGATQIYGYTAEEMIGRSVALLVPPDRPDELPQIMAKLKRGEQIDHFETVRVRKDGTRIYVSLTISPIRDADGIIVGASTIARDITEQKRALDAQRFLADASALLASSLDSTTTLQQLARLTIPFLADTCVVDIVETDGTLRRVAVAAIDPAMEERLRDLQHRYPPDLRAVNTRQVLETGEPVLIPEISDAFLTAAAQDAEHLELLRSLGARSALTVPLLARGRAIGAIALGTGVSGRRYGPADLPLAEELAHRAALAVDNARLYQEAQAAIRMRDQFLSIAAHELKTPLTSLLGYAALVQRRATAAGTLTERDRRGLGVIVAQAQRLNKLITALLDLGRIETGQLSIAREPVDVGVLARQIVEEMQPTLDRHTLELHCPDEPLIIEGDSVRLAQVVQNLVENALKYSPAGGPVIVQVERRGSMAAMAVSDQGIGIPPAAQARLFQRFYRAPNANAEQISGMGIGLYIVREIVVLHGGSVEVSSQEGQGSTFTITLPLARQ